MHRASHLLPSSPRTEIHVAVDAHPLWAGFRGAHPSPPSSAHLPRCLPALRAGYFTWLDTAVLLQVSFSAPCWRSARGSQPFQLTTCPFAPLLAPSHPPSSLPLPSRLFPSPPVRLSTTHTASPSCHRVLLELGSLTERGLLPSHLGAWQSAAPELLLPPPGHEHDGEGRRGRDAAGDAGGRASISSSVLQPRGALPT